MHAETSWNSAGRPAQPVTARLAAGPTRRHAATLAASLIAGACAAAWCAAPAR